ncbi:MAG: hypothetical protein ABSB40_12865 [Nitrososphaeria archaeon]|jgi:hypothetical protein
MPFTSSETERAYVSNMLNNYYRAGILNGESRSALYNNTIGTDLGIRKTDSLAISREADAQAAVIQSLRDLPSGSPIQQDNMLQMNANGQKDYMYKVEATITNSDGYLLDQGYYPLWSNAILTKEQIKNAVESIKVTDEGSDINIASGDVTEAFRNTA